MPSVERPDLRTAPRAEAHGVRGAHPRADPRLREGARGAAGADGALRGGLGLGGQG